MAFNKAPNTWLDSWSENGLSIYVPISTFPELTAAEADATTGDIRKVVWSILQKFYNEYNERNTDDQPTKWTSTKTVSVNAKTGVVTNTFINKVYTEIDTQEVSDE